MVAHPISTSEMWHELKVIVCDVMVGRWLGECHSNGVSVVAMVGSVGVMVLSVGE